MDGYDLSRSFRSAFIFIIVVVAVVAVAVGVIIGKLL
jgi:hypothetical protein